MAVNEQRIAKRADQGVCAAVPAGIPVREPLFTLKLDASRELEQHRGINLRGVFAFPVEQYAEQLLPSLAAGKSRLIGA